VEIVERIGMVEKVGIVEEEVAGIPVEGVVHILGRGEVHKLDEGGDLFDGRCLWEVLEQIVP